MRRFVKLRWLPLTFQKTLQSGIRKRKHVFRLDLVRFARVIWFPENEQRPVELAVLKLLQTPWPIRFGSASGSSDLGPDSLGAYRLSPNRSLDSQSH